MTLPHVSRCHICLPAPGSQRASALLRRLPGPHCLQDQALVPWHPWLSTVGPRRPFQTPFPVSPSLMKPIASTPDAVISCPLAPPFPSQIYNQSYLGCVAWHRRHLPCDTFLTTLAEKHHASWNFQPLGSHPMTSYITQWSGR